MQLIFTKDIGRFKKGDVKDYPLTTWNKIASDVKLKLDNFTRPIEEVLSNGGNFKQPDTKGSTNSQSGRFK